MDAPTNKKDAPAVRALLASPATLSRTESFPHGVTKPSSWAHHIYQCIRTTKLDMGKVHTQGWESVLSQCFPHRLVCLSCDPRRFTWKAEIEYGSSLSKRKPILEHDSSPEKLKHPTSARKSLHLMVCNVAVLLSITLSLHGSPHSSGLDTPGSAGE